MQEGRQYPKKLRVWQQNQDGSPNELAQKVEYLYNNGLSATFHYETDHWQTENGEDRRTNVIRKIVQEGASAPLGSPSPQTPTSAPPVIGGTATEQLFEQLHLLISNIQGDLSRLAAAISAAEESLRPKPLKIGEEPGWNPGQQASPVQGFTTPAEVLTQWTQ